MQPDIIALGEPMFEFSACEEGDLSEIQHFAAGWGGDTSNFAIAASRSGGRVGYLTRLGDDIFAESLLRLWEAEGIDTRHVVRDPTAHTAVYVTTRKGNRHCFSYLRRGSAACAMRPDFLPRDYIRSARVLHASGISQAISGSACDTVLSAMHTAAEAGGMISYDPNLRLSLWPLETARDVIHRTCRLADVFFPSIEEARLLAGLESAEDLAKFYLDLGPRIVVLKLGHEGALLAVPGMIQRFPALNVPAVDMAGAGDAFAGAFIAAFLARENLEDCMRWANAAAALTTTGLGCVRPIPRRRQISELLGARTPSEAQVDLLQDPS